MLPFRYVVADGLDGHRPEVLQAVEDAIGPISFVAIPADTRCGLPGPVMQTKPSTDPGKRRTTRVVAAREQAPIAVETLATSLHDGCWSRRTVSEGTQGPMAYECTKRQVTLGGDGLPVRTVWLVMTRTVGVNPSSWDSLRNAPVRTR